MDIFAHTLWTTALYAKKYKQNKKLLALSAFMGVIPDLLSFTPIFIYAILSGESVFSPSGIGQKLLAFASESYNYTHSFILFATLFIVVTILRKGKIWWPLFGWALHIGIDIFTHRGFYETPFLFPLSGYRFSHGISWAHPTFMLINYSALALVYITIFLIMRKNSKPRSV